MNTIRLIETIELKRDVYKQCISSAVESHGNIWRWNKWCNKADRVIYKLICKIGAR